MLLELRRFLAFISWTAFIECQMEPFVVGGEKATIINFPHSVFVYMKCFDETGTGFTWICGASIVNELIILTAAHCFDGCFHHRYISTFVGHSERAQGSKSTVETFSRYPDYNEGYSGYDLALARLKTRIKFGAKVKRIALMKSPPYYEKAQVAGWGLTIVSTI